MALTVDWFGFASGCDYSVDDGTGNSPMRRKSNVNIDAIHDIPLDSEMAPAQLYSTESGRLFHSGKIAIVTVGLPARGKTCVPLPLIKVGRSIGRNEVKADDRGYIQPCLCGPLQISTMVSPMVES